MKKQYLMIAFASSILASSMALAATHNHNKTTNENATKTTIDSLHQKTNEAMQTVKMAASDATMTAAIKAKYAADHMLNPFDINVTTQNSVVVLSGQVDTDMQYQQAVTLAEATNSVKDVNAENLKVTKSNSPLRDLYVTAKVNGVILKENIMKNDDVMYWPIKIETKNSVVYLSGHVDSQKQKQAIEKITKLVDGVKSVKNMITVTPTNGKKSE